MIKTLSSFCEHVVTPAVQQTWDRFPTEKLLSVKKVALFTVTLLALYKIYRSFQSLQNRVKKLEDDLSDYKIRLANEGRNSKALADRVAQLEQKDGYESCEEENPAMPPRAAPVLTPIEQFKQLIPGRHIQYKTRSEEINFADFFLKKIFRIDEQPACTIDAEGRFSLTFTCEKVINVSRLPSPDEGEVAWIRQAIQGIISAMGSPQIQISKVMSGKIDKTDLGTTITFDATSIFLVPKATYTAHLKSITVLNAPTAQGHHLKGSGEHNSWTLGNHKGGFMHFHKLVEFLELNPLQSPKRAATSSSDSDSDE